MRSTTSKINEYGEEFVEYLFAKYVEDNRKLIDSQKEADEWERAFEEGDLLSYMNISVKAGIEKIPDRQGFEPLPKHIVEMYKKYVHEATNAELGDLDKQTLIYFIRHLTNDTKRNRGAFTTFEDQVLSAAKKYGWYLEVKKLIMLENITLTSAISIVAQKSFVDEETMRKYYYETKKKMDKRNFK
jgi:hypothetical protein